MVILRLKMQGFPRTLSNDPNVNKTNAQKNILYHPLVSVKNVLNDILIGFLMCFKFSTGLHSVFQKNYTRN